MNANLAEYHVPVNADVPSLEAILIEETDPYVNALGIKGVGEIGITGTAGAIANAVWHATGVRVRRFPITLEQLIGAATAWEMRSAIGERLRRRRRVNSAPHPQRVLDGCCEPALSSVQRLERLFSMAPGGEA